MKTEADRIRQHPQAYQMAIARMVYRDAPHDSDRVTFHFEDGSTITFKKVYQIEPE